MTDRGDRTQAEGEGRPCQEGGVQGKGKYVKATGTSTSGRGESTVLRGQKEGQRVSEGRVEGDGRERLAKSRGHGACRTWICF